VPLLTGARGGQRGTGGREELGLAQQLVGGVRAGSGRPVRWRSRRAERLYIDGLACVAVQHLDDGAEVAHTECARRLVVRCGPEVLPLVLEGAAESGPGIYTHVPVSQQPRSDRVHNNKSLGLTQPKN
jgi:hypothetical protein